MPLTEQLIVRASGPMTRDVLDRLRSLLRLERVGRLTDAEDVYFGRRYLRSDGDFTNLALLRDDDSHWRVKLTYADEPVPADTVQRVRADVLAAFAEVGLTVDGVWQRPESTGRAMVDRPPSAFAGPGRFWRGGLHAHSDRSDGALTPAAVVDRYRSAGYDFVAVTDHFRAVYGFPVTDTRALRSDGFTTLIGAELHAPGPELSAEWHLIAAGLPLDFAPLRPGETGPQLARRARAAGAFIGIAHPAASLLTLADADRLDAAHAVETHNVLAGREDRADSWHFYDALLARGRRLSAYAADDAHFQPGDPPGCRSWVQVRATSLDPAELVAALTRGAYYSSTGPQITAVNLDADEVHVACSPAARVILTGGLPGCQLVTGQELTRVTIPLGFLADASHVRVTVVDATGNRAWTNPSWLT